MLGYAQAQEGDPSVLAVALGSGPGVFGPASPGEPLPPSWARPRVFGGDQAPGHCVYGFNAGMGLMAASVPCAQGPSTLHTGRGHPITPLVSGHQTIDPVHNVPITVSMLLSAAAPFNFLIPGVPTVFSLLLPPAPPHLLSPGRCPSFCSPCPCHTVTPDTPHHLSILQHPPPTSLSPVP